MVGLFKKKKKKNFWLIVFFLNYDKKLNVNSAMLRCVFEVESFDFVRIYDYFLNKMKSGVGGSGSIDRGGFRGFR